MENNQTTNSEFKKGFKATGLFGGLQVFKILVSVVNAKIIAVLLGPYGVGIMGLLNSTTSVISNATSFGLSTSAVRDVTASFATEDKESIGRTVSVFKKLIWFTGLLGMFVCGLFSPVWSKFTFGNYDYTWAFLALSVTLLFLQLSAGQVVMLQGTKQFKKIAKAGFWGALLGLFLSTPFYYFFKVDGIVPALIAVSLSALILTYLYSRDIEYEKTRLSLKEVFKDGRKMLGLGFFVAVQGFLTMLFAYIVRVYISNHGSVEDVGIYNAGFNVINTYVGMIFAAIGTEYYPRISSYANENSVFINGVNQQVELVLILTSPMISFFMVFCDIIIIILYSSEFLVGFNMVLFGILAVIFKGPSWCMGFTFLAKGDTKAFFYNEVLSGLVALGLNVFLYYKWGLTGLGVSFVLQNLYYYIQCYFICRKLYDYQISKPIITIFFKQFFICCIILVFTIVGSKVMRYSIGIPLALISLTMSIIDIDKRIDLKSVFLRFKK